jgi:hypothetical protein
VVSPTEHPRGTSGFTERTAPGLEALDAVAERLRADRLVIGNHQLGGVIGVELAACRPVSSAMQLLGEPVDDLVVGVL